LNSITVRDRDILWYIDNFLDMLYRSQYFTKLDLSSSYDQQQIHSDDYHKIAFILLEGLFEWQDLPLGLTNTPAVFMHYIHSLAKILQVLGYLSQRNYDPFEVMFGAYRACRPGAMKYR
jgi:hypothetical protein